jgi:hypothetical protein
VSALSDHKRVIALVRAKAAEEKKPGQRVSHQDLMAAAELLAAAAEKERKAGNLFRSSEINHLTIATFRAAIRVEDIVPETGGR